MDALIRWSPLGGLTLRSPFDVLDEFDRIASSFWGELQPTEGEARLATVDVYEDKDDLVVKAELPGVDKDKIGVSLEDGVLRITAEKEGEKKEELEGRKYYTSERWSGKYSRTLALPYDVDGEKATATYEGSTLEVRLPKAESVKPKKIDIK